MAGVWLARQMTPQEICTWQLSAISWPPKQGYNDVFKDQIMACPQWLLWDQFFAGPGYGQGANQRPRFWTASFLLERYAQTLFQDPGQALSACRRRPLSASHSCRITGSSSGRVPASLWLGRRDVMHTWQQYHSKENLEEHVQENLVQQRLAVCFDPEVLLLFDRFQAFISTICRRGS